jgi:hypothetical protein
MTRHSAIERSPRRMRDSASAAAFRALAESRRYSSVTIDRWLRLAADDGAALLTLAQELRLGENQLRDVWDWAEEIAARDGVSLADVLAMDGVVAARRRAIGRNDKLKQIKGALRRLRFPQLSAVEDRLQAHIRALGLPENIRVRLPEFLEGDALQIEVVATSADGLRQAAAHLLAAAQASACEAIFQLLGEVE